ncbi:MAG: HEAT repeat domain-containing protein [Blastocatellia bacterium]|nr:HEAT repeat domain-containing protein [Blastocatellia bacterium]
MRGLVVILVTLIGSGSFETIAVQENPEAAKRALIEQLRAPDATRRRDALLALSAFHDPALLPLFQMAAQDSEASVRAAAIMALGQFNPTEASMGLKEVIPLLLQAVRDSHPLVRRAAAWTLGRVRDPRATNALREAARDSDAAVRAAAIEALAEHPDDVALPTLLERLQDKDAFVRRQAARALGRWRAQAATIPLITRMTREKDPEVKRAIAWALGEIGDPQATETLRTLSRSPDPYLSEAAREALRKVRARER